MHNTLYLDISQPPEITMATQQLTPGLLFDIEAKSV